MDYIHMTPDNVITMTGDHDTRCPPVCPTASAYPIDPDLFPEVEVNNARIG